MKTKIISAFPGLGKTYFSEKSKNTAIDLDAAHFSWIYDNEGNKVKRAQESEFVRNYVNCIYSYIGTVDFIFISSFKSIEEKFEIDDTKYIEILPMEEDYDAMKKIYEKRGNDSKFISLMKRNYIEYIRNAISGATRAEYYCNEEIKEYRFGNTGRVVYLISVSDGWNLESFIKSFIMYIDL